MNRFGTVLKTKVLGGVLVAGMALPVVAGVPAEAQWRGGYDNRGYAPDYRQSYEGDHFYNNDRNYNHNDLRYDYDRHHGVGPGKGALIGGAAGLVLGGILGGGKGALIGGAAGAGVGAVAGAANQNAHRGYGNYGYGNSWNGGYNGYGYSNRGYGYRGY
ncbi:hypothetical protein [Terriglobus aquaticus]|uniref:Glycine zipper n=1 Tax=Terriglobus aquaticus TaxID=940139 RepID=A0ABW9KH00_9BACT|nr:hypothetical protein [Terriglobus aquaticus]